MSATYTLVLQNEIVRTIHVEDEIQHRIELSPLLPPEEMRLLLRQQLAAAGWQEDAQGRLARQDDQGDALWDVEAGVLAVRIAVDQELIEEIATKVTARSRAGAQAMAQHMIKQRSAQLEEEADAAMAETQAEIKARLLAGDSARTAEIQKVLQQTYAEALKIKAAQLGTVSSIEENDSPDAYTLTIRIDDV